MLESLLTIWWPTLLAGAVRVGGVVFAAPVFSASAVPRRLRVFLSAVLALAAAARLGAPVPVPAGGLQLATGLAGELAIGLCLGYAARLLLVAGQLAAVQAGWQMGVSLGQVFRAWRDDPGQPVGRLLWLLTTAVFLAIGGHRMVLGGLLATFESIPLLSFAPGLEVSELVASLLAASFALAVKLAAPVLVALLVVTVALGLLQRAVPQLHVLSIGLPVRAAVGLLAMAGAAGVIAALVETGWLDLWTIVERFLARVS